MTQENIMDLDLLTPGSVWIRENGKEARFLFIANDGLPAKQQEMYPRVAVYADEQNHIFSVPVDHFIGKRSFYNVSPSLEIRLENLLAYSGDEEFNLNDDEDELFISDNEPEETVDSESNEASESTGFEVHAASAPHGEVSPVEVTPIKIDASKLVNPFPVTYSSGSTGLPEIISSQRLTELTESYQQQPLLSEGKILHTLYIRAASDVNQERLYASFSPTHIDKNAVFTFSVNTAEGRLDIDWDALVGIYPYVFREESMYQVMFTTDQSGITYSEIAEFAEEPINIVPAFMTQPMVALKIDPVHALNIDQVMQTMQIDTKADDPFTVVVE